LNSYDNDDNDRVVTGVPFPSVAPHGFVFVLIVTLASGMADYLAYSRNQFPTVFLSRRFRENIIRVILLRFRPLGVNQRPRLYMAEPSLSW
jgi:hypothetical protein